MMISDEAYRRLRNAFRRTGQIDRELYELLLRLVRVVVFHGRLPPALSPTGQWDLGAANDATHGWIERRLLRTNALLAAFDLADSPRPFLRSLERNFRHYLINESERSELDNLISRTGALLRDDARFNSWIELTQPSDSWWGLAGLDWKEIEPFQGADERLVSAAWALGMVSIIRYSQSVARASPILSSEELGRFLERLFERVQALLTLRHLAVVFERRFDLGTPAVVELAPATAEPEASEQPNAEMINAAVAAVVSDLSERQFRVLIRRAEDATLDEIAADLGISRGTVDNDLRNAGPIIDRYCTDGLTREQILEKVVDILS
jgi:DNA-binding CsgD family transcriptional regulator